MVRSVAGSIKLFVECIRVPSCGWIDSFDGRLRSSLSVLESGDGVEGGDGTVEPPAGPGLLSDESTLSKGSEGGSLSKDGIWLVPSLFGESCLVMEADDAS